MMTGYLHEAYDKRMDFKAFAALCARAFGATILMRDDPLDTPIPDEFKPSPFAAEHLKMVRAQVAEIEATNEARALAMGEKLKCEAIDMYTRLAKENADSHAFMSALLTRVEAWTPPTPDHEGLKKFMREQLESSMEYNRPGQWDEDIEKWRAKSPADIFAAHRVAAHRSLAIAIESEQAEIKRANDRTSWVRALRESLK